MKNKQMDTKNNLILSYDHSQKINHDNKISLHIFHDLIYKNLGHNSNKNNINRDHFLTNGLNNTPDV